MINLQVQIQDFVLGGKKFGEGSGDHLWSPVGPGQSPGRGTWGQSPLEVNMFSVLLKLYLLQF